MSIPSIWYYIQKDSDQPVFAAARSIGSRDKGFFYATTDDNYQSGPDAI